MINQYKYFLAVAKHENLHRAADELYITQPALSASVSRLEKELDVTLLEREGRNIRLTPIARKLVPYFTAVCEDYAEIYKAINDYKRSVSKTVVMGTTIRHTVLAVDEYLLAAPGKEITLRQYFKYEDLKNALLSRSIDLCVSSPVVSGAGICSELLINEPLCVLMHADNPLSGREYLSLEELADKKSYAHPDGFPFNTVLERVFRETGCRQPQIVATAENASIMLMLISDRGKDTVMINPISRCREIVGVYPALTFVPLIEPNCYRDIGVSWPANAPLSENAREIVRFLHVFYTKEKYHL